MNQKASHQQTLRCLYGAHDVTKNSDEHVFSKKLGCPNSFIIRGVCKVCNETTLSMLDTELLDNSPLALVNSYSGTSSQPRKVWAVDENDEHLLVEGYYDAISRGIRPFPQLIFRNDNFEIRGDATEILDVGQDRFRDLLLKCAVASLDPGTRFINDPINEEYLVKPFYFPPRVFARSLQDLAKERRLFCRYIKQDNKILMQALLEGRQKGFKNLTIKPTSTTGKFYIHYCPTILQRAIFKTALNLIKFACRNTDINFHSFRNLADIVMGHRIESKITRKYFAGFMRVNETEFLATNPDEHVLTLGYKHGYWHFCMAFFGRTVGMGAAFPGPAHESWGSIKYVVSTKRKSFTTEESWGFWPPAGELTWDLGQLLPSVDIKQFSTKELLIQANSNGRVNLR